MDKLLKHILVDVVWSRVRLRILDLLRLNFVVFLKLLCYLLVMLILFKFRVEFGYIHLIILLELNLLHSVLRFEFLFELTHNFNTDFYVTAILTLKRDVYEVIVAMLFMTLWI
jgi:hypothetical protein